MLFENPKILENIMNNSSFSKKFQKKTKSENPLHPVIKPIYIIKKHVGNLWSQIYFSLFSLFFQTPIFVEMIKNDKIKVFGALPFF